MNEQRRPEFVVEAVPEDPSHPDGATDMYLIFDGRRIAKRGKPGTPHDASPLILRGLRVAGFDDTRSGKSGDLRIDWAEHRAPSDARAVGCRATSYDRVRAPASLRTTFLLPPCFHGESSWKQLSRPLREIDQVQRLTGAPEEIRTPDPQIRSLIRAHFASTCTSSISPRDARITPVTSAFLIAMSGHLRYIPGHGMSSDCRA